MRSIAICIGKSALRRCYIKRKFVCEFILSMVAVVRVFCQSRSDTALEVLALRQQVSVLARYVCECRIDVRIPDITTEENGQDPG